MTGSGAQGDLIPKISSYRRVEMVTPYQKAKMSFNYHRWLGQTNETAWKQTQQSGSQQVIREQYTTPLNDNAFPSASPTNAAPAIVLVFGINIATSSSSVIGTLRVRCNYTFRQRNMLTGAPFFETQNLRDGSRHYEKHEEERAGSAPSELSMSVIQRALTQ